MTTFRVALASRDREGAADVGHSLAVVARQRPLNIRNGLRSASRRGSNLEGEAKLAHRFDCSIAVAYPLRTGAGSARRAAARARPATGGTPVGNLIKNVLIFGGGLAVLAFLVMPLMFPGKTSGKIKTDTGKWRPTPKIEEYRQGNKIIKKVYYN
jgi:hypothetical protein